MLQSGLWLDSLYTGSSAATATAGTVRQAAAPVSAERSRIQCQWLLYAWLVFCKLLFNQCASSWQKAVVFSLFSGRRACSLFLSARACLLLLCSPQNFCIAKKRSALTALSMAIENRTSETHLLPASPVPVACLPAGTQQAVPRVF